jgi:hypothetical protein
VETLRLIRVLIADNLPQLPHVFTYADAPDLGMATCPSRGFFCVLEVNREGLSTAKTNAAAVTINAAVLVPMT